MLVDAPKTRPSLAHKTGLSYQYVCKISEAPELVIGYLMSGRTFLEET